jgi:uncharacterized protein (DUF305 family)
MIRSSFFPHVFLVVTVLGCGTAQQPVPAVPEPAAHPAPRMQHTQADVRFMRDMIHHHAQAIVISEWAPTHDAGAEIRTLAERIINAQKDEIASMQKWLRDRGEAVPDPKAKPAMMQGGAHHEGHHTMPGMLTEAQLRELDATRGEEFERLFLRLMIQHHRGAVTMVNELFGSVGAAQDESVFKLAADISADQSSEIARMQRMLAARTLGIEIR